MFLAKVIYSSIKIELFYHTSKIIEILMASSVGDLFGSLPDELNRLIIGKMPYYSAYKLMENESNREMVMKKLLKDGKEMLIELETHWIHPESGYIPIPDYATFDFSSLDAITRQLWNAIICVDGQLNSDYDLTDLLDDVQGFLTMECPPPPSYDAMRNNMWQNIILLALDTEYHPGMDWLGRKKYKYIQRAIEEYPSVHELDTLAKQKYALGILIQTFIERKEEIMHMYPGHVNTHQKFYNELVDLICQASDNGYEENLIVHPLFARNTFNFMKRPSYQV